MIVDVDPVAHVGAVAVNRQRLARQGVQCHQGDQFLRELPGSVVVAGVGDHRRQAVGVVPGADQMVGRRLGRGIRAARVVWRGFGERRIAVVEGAEYLIGGDVMEAERGLAGGVEAGVVPRAASSRVKVPTTLVRTKSAGPSIERSTWLSAARCMTASGSCVSNTWRMAAASAMSARTSMWRWWCARLLQRLFRGGVGHLVDVDHHVAGVPDQMADHGGPDETTATGQ